jgi:hypothetical protein
MDTDGTADLDGGSSIDLCDKRLADGVLELIRSLGIRVQQRSGPAKITEADPDNPGQTRQRQTSIRYRMQFTTDLPVFRLPRKLARLPKTLRATQDWNYITDIRLAAPQEMRCIKVDHPEHLYLTGGFIPTHNSVSLQVFLYPAAVQGCEIYVVDPTKGGADFGFVRPYAKAFAGTVDEAAALMKHVYGEVRRRIAVNTAHQVGSYRDLPDDIRPKHIYLVMDEFTSLMQADAVSKSASDDPEVEDDRQAQLRANASKLFIGTMTGKIAREARSAGVTLVLATQKLSAKMLDAVPGANDLKTNLSRMLMGNATSGERASALKNFVDAPSLGDHVPRGRGLWETSAGIAEIIQVWFEPSQVTFGKMLAERRDPLPDSERVDLYALMPKAAESTAEFQEIKKSPQVIVEDLGEVEVNFDDMMSFFEAEADTDSEADSDADADEAEPFDSTMFIPVEEIRSNEHPTNVIFLDVDGVVAPIASTAGDPEWGSWEQHMITGMGAVGVSADMLHAFGTAPATLVWLSDWAEAANPAFASGIGRDDLPTLFSGEGDDHGWWKIGAAEAYVRAHPGIERILWVDDKLSEEGPTGLTWGELAEDIMGEFGAQMLILTPELTVGLTKDDWDYAGAWLNGSVEADIVEFGIQTPEPVATAQETYPPAASQPLPDVQAAAVQPQAPEVQDLYEPVGAPPLAPRSPKMPLVNDFSEQALGKAVETSPDEFAARAQKVAPAPASDWD